MASGFVVCTPRQYFIGVGPIHAQNLLVTVAVGDGVQRQRRSSVPHFHGTVVTHTGQIKLTVVAPSYTRDLRQKKKINNVSAIPSTTIRTQQPSNTRTHPE